MDDESRTLLRRLKQQYGGVQDITAARGNSKPFLTMYRIAEVGTANDFIRRLSAGEHLTEVDWTAELRCAYDTVSAMIKHYKEE